MDETIGHILEPQYTFFMKKIERKNGPKKQSTIKWLFGIDEVGRGPLAGPVAVCVCAIPYHGSAKESYKKFLDFHKAEIKKLKLPSLRGKDSKKLSSGQREEWKKFLETSRACFEYCTATAKEIDEKGIAVCIRELIHKNLGEIFSKNGIRPDEAQILLDGGLKAHHNFIFQKTIIKGDEKEMVISFASIFAKVTRDQYMTELSLQDDFKRYKFNSHKGYGTAAHRALIQKLGLSSLHRRTFCTRIPTNEKA
jgi:ribonuclease HII